MAVVLSPFAWFYTKSEPQEKELAIHTTILQQHEYEN